VLSPTPSVSESSLFATVPLQSPLAAAAAPAPPAASHPSGRDDTVVSVKNVHKTYLLGVEGVPALRGVSLDIKRCVWHTARQLQLQGFDTCHVVCNFVREYFFMKRKMFFSFCCSGEFIVILGKSGSGKTSMLNLLGTIDKPTKGDLTICGTVINAKTTDEALAFLRLKRMCVFRNPSYEDTFHSCLHFSTRHF
jgi:ABC-type multidrug transport system fused ATPase/permease subunit